MAPLLRARLLVVDGKVDEAVSCWRASAAR
jgi:hypothetical protein